ncbi:hypothetical protein [Tepidibacillus marianensis]|uniref:hypothetical protein n=1 Tax=Tepidibacillus marianensis TaxID=3131995 RepID=UPI0030CBCE30
MALPKSSFTDTTSKNYLIDAAVLFYNVTFDELAGEFSGTLAGATSGGVTFTDERSYRDIEVDGATKMKVKGNKVLESANATLVANVKELTAENIRKAINGTIRDALATEAPAGFKVIEPKVAIDDADYIENMALYGKLSSGQEIIVIIDNALATGGLEIATEDNNEAVVEMTFEAHATVEQLNSGTLPWRILMPGIAA